MADSSQLLHFLTATTSNLQEALSKPSNGKKVNHRKYIQKRLQRGSNNGKLNKKSTQPKPQTTAASAATRATVTTAASPRAQPVATLSQTTSCPRWPLTAYEQYQPAALPTSSSTNSLLSAVSSPSSLPYSRPPSCTDFCDPDLESLLYEIGLDNSPSQYSDSTADHASSTVVPPVTTSASPPLTWDSYIPSTTDFIPSPPSDFSDIDDSAYSSPCNPSPVYYPPGPVVNTTSQPSASCYHQHVATGSCEWLPSTVSACGPPTVSLSTSLMHITPTLTPSLLSDVTYWNL